MPCDVIGLDLQDEMGNHIQDYSGQLFKHRLDKNGNELSVHSDRHSHSKCIASGKPSTWFPLDRLGELNTIEFWLG